MASAASRHRSTVPVGRAASGSVCERQLPTAAPTAGGKQPRVLVTGGANGIGRGIVDAFVEAGATVVYADLQPRGAAVGFGGAAPSTAAGAHFVRCDVGDAAQSEGAVAQAIQLMGGLDVLVNNVIEC